MSYLWHRMCWCRDRPATRGSWCRWMMTFWSCHIASRTSLRDGAKDPESAHWCSDPEPAREMLPRSSSRETAKWPVFTLDKLVLYRVFNISWLLTFCQKLPHDLLQYYCEIIHVHLSFFFFFHCNCIKWKAFVLYFCFPIYLPTLK